jgi:hypothetical protein
MEVAESAADLLIYKELGLFLYSWRDKF